jgi:hypothetical protein
LLNATNEKATSTAPEKYNTVFFYRQGDEVRQAAKEGKEADRERKRSLHT